MQNKINCPVCRMNFLANKEVSAGEAVICSICGAKLQILAVNEEPVKTQRYHQDPETEIRERVDTFARLRDYEFNEDKEELIQGLLEKHQHHGDFYCPCRFDNVPENICPCLETRQNAVKKEGHCL